MKVRLFNINFLGYVQDQLQSKIKSYLQEVDVTALAALISCLIFFCGRFFSEHYIFGIFAFIRQLVVQRS